MGKAIILVILLILSLSCVSFAQEDAEPAQEVDGFSLVQYEDGGKKKWELNGKSAEVEDDKVKVNEVSAVLFGEETAVKLKARKGSLDREGQIVLLENNVVAKTTDGIKLTTDTLQWDAENKNAFTDAAVTIKKADFDVNGKGAEVDLETRKLKLKEDVTANIKTAAPSYLRTTSDESRTTITCDGPLDINYKKNRATFRNNVKVEDSQGHILADRIDVYFNQDTRRIRLVVARGNVRIINGENVTYSEKAIYLVDQGRVILPRRPRLVIKNERSE